MMTELQILEQLKRKYNAEMVSALVGAGFTRNAYGKALDWAKMLGELVEKAYADELNEMYQNYTHNRFCVDVKPFDEMKDSFIETIIGRDGYLGVVSHFINKKGFREAIDYYIETHNPCFYKMSDGRYGVRGDDETVLTDKDFTVHQRFLKGKWQYVFTTNFDNALEFVNEQFNMGYIPVYADYQMSRRKMARPIVKIHGSIVAPDETLKKPFVFDGDHTRRYIISQEDFDSYFQRHEAFSYLLRVAMLSGAYLLLGFSGDDPNFKSWLNWVKDVIDKDSNRDGAVGNEDETGTLVKEGEDNLKVYLVLVDNKEIPIEQQLYYQNHHIGVIHLGNQEIMQKLRCFDDTPTSIRLDHFLNYLIGDHIDATDELKGTLVSKPSLYDRWYELSEELSKGREGDEILEEIKSRRIEERFYKSVSCCEYVLFELYKKKEALSETEKEILKYLVFDAGMFRGQIKASIQSQMTDDPFWNNMNVHEETLGGVDEKEKELDDVSAQENILRSLYHFDFSEAKSALKRWSPEGNYKAIKASLNYYYDQTDSLKLLDSLIINSPSDVEKYVASFLYNCIDNNFYPYYSLNEYRNKGLIGLSDSINYILESLRNKRQELAEYGHEVTRISVDGEDIDSNRERSKALRFIQLISREGYNLCYGIVNMVNVTDWYMVFRQLYSVLPFPCMYYSCQYNNRNVLRRIGQDFAFEPKLKDVVPMLLHQIFDALSCKDTPVVLKSGMLQIGSQLFFGIKEDIWFEGFKKYFKETYIPEVGGYLYSSFAKSFVQSAMVCMYEPTHISEVLTLTLDYFEKKAEESIGFMSFRLRLNKLNVLNDEQHTLVEKIVKAAEFKDVVSLFRTLKEHNLHDEDMVKQFVDSTMLQPELLKKADRYTLFGFCLLAEDNPDVVELLKKEILSRNIWECGAHKGIYSQTGQLFIMHLGKSFQWDEDELSIIYENLKSNLEKISPRMLERDVVFGDSYAGLLMDMLTFADKYPQLVEEVVKDDILSKLKKARHFDSLEEWLYSSYPEDVERVCEVINQQLREGKFKENKKYFDIVLNKCIMKSAPAITECLVTIAVAIHFCQKHIRKKYYDHLYRLLIQYKGRDLRDLDLQVIHAGHALMVVAKFLNEKGIMDENVKWWLDNETLNRLNFMEF